MSSLHYFSWTSSLPSSGSVASLMSEALLEANWRVSSLATETNEDGQAPKHATKTYSSYSAENRAHAIRYAAKHGPTKALRHFTVSESTARLLKKQYLAKLNNQCQNIVKIPDVTSLPTKAHGHPLLHGSTQVREYIIALWATVGMVNTAIVLAAAEGIVAATDHCLLRQHGGSLVLTKAWDKSVLSRMEFEKLKDSTSAKLPVPDF